MYCFAFILYVSPLTLKYLAPSLGRKSTSPVDSTTLMSSLSTASRFVTLIFVGRMNLLAKSRAQSPKLSFVVVWPQMFTSGWSVASAPGTFLTRLRQ